MGKARKSTDSQPGEASGPRRYKRQQRTHASGPLTLSFGCGLLGRREYACVNGELEALSPDPAKPRKATGSQS